MGTAIVIFTLFITLGEILLFRDIWKIYGFKSAMHVAVILAAMNVILMLILTGSIK